MSVLLRFSLEDVVPDVVYLQYLKFPLKSYIPYAIQCYRCFRFGHKAEGCRAASARCSVCAEAHEFKDCPNRASPKCANCGGNHVAIERTCPAYLEVKQVLTVVASGKSYRDAVKVVKAQETGSTSSGSQTNNPAPIETMQQQNTNNTVQITPIVPIITKVSISTQTDSVSVATQTVPVPSMASKSEGTTAHETQVTPPVGGTGYSVVPSKKLGEFFVTFFKFFSNNRNKSELDKLNKLAQITFGLSPEDLGLGQAHC